MINDEIKKRLADGEPLLPHEASAMFLDMEQEHLLERERLQREIFRLEARRTSWSVFPSFGEISGYVYGFMVFFLCATATVIVYLVLEPPKSDSVTYPGASPGASCFNERRNRHSPQA